MTCWRRRHRPGRKWRQKSRCSDASRSSKMILVGRAHEAFATIQRTTRLTKSFGVFSNPITNMRLHFTACLMWMQPPYKPAVEQRRTIARLIGKRHSYFLFDTFISLFPHHRKSLCLPQPTHLHLRQSQCRRAFHEEANHHHHQNHPQPRACIRKQPCQLGT